MKVLNYVVIFLKTKDHHLKTTQSSKVFNSATLAELPWFFRDKRRPSPVPRRSTSILEKRADVDHEVEGDHLINHWDRYFGHNIVRISNASMTSSGGMKAKALISSSTGFQKDAFLEFRINYIYIQSNSS
ncbi:unnamed protein product [Lepeophtheirus salmonis]|uniref:(salmon louse) hypothetical protein n=1 Tax=Lepeophtheirus salmonis TaxID=72036 RepID=A0A7R8CZE9_LEPSM|nr:unnamed protein product [Lepeophtheirus salmonis]CAF2949553.1 unnamed protein product [Lepeophtheirus salmonis]